MPKLGFDSGLIRQFNRDESFIAFGLESYYAIIEGVRSREVKWTGNRSTIQIFCDCNQNKLGSCSVL